MKDFRYKVVKGFLTCAAFLPLRVLYVVADVIYLIMYHMVKYRRDIVERNLRGCFPDMDDAGRRAIERKFYRNLADIIVETVKLLHISDATIKKHIVFENIGLIDSYTAQGKSVAVYFAHCGNWEWGTSMTISVDQATRDRVEYCQVYRPLRNRLFDRLMLDVRSRFDSLSLPKSMVLRDLIKLRRAGKITVTGFMSDQKPSHGDPTVPIVFLGRPTAFISGTEHLAAKMGMPAVYWDTDKIARGRYKVTCRLLADDPASLPDRELTHRYAAALQQTILRDPSIWLWTHDRWKYPLPKNLINELYKV